MYGKLQGNIDMCKQTELILRVYTINFVIMTLTYLVDVMCE